MPRVVMSVHGNAFLSEQYENIVVYDSNGFPIVISNLDAGHPRGWGRTFSQSGWYHVTIPTLLAYDGRTSDLEEVLILFYSENMRFDEAHIWKGGTFLVSATPDVVTPTNLLFRPRLPTGERFQTNSGLGVSLRFTNTGGGYITFSSASATFFN